MSVDVDLADVRLAQRASGVLREFNDAGVLTAADIHVATRLGSLVGEDDGAVLLAAALAVRAPRLAHVCVELTSVRDTATSDLDEPVDLHVLPWPDVDDWIARLSASPLVAVGDEGPPNRALRFDGTRLYLDRYWREERRIAADLLARSSDPPTDFDTVLLDAGLARLFDGDEPDEPDLQRAAAEAAVRCRFAVVAGGPGTGKTTTVARILALLDEQAAAEGRPPPRVALAAPTGKAAARLEEAVHAEAAAIDISDDVRARLLGLSASTLHRLLGWRPGVRSRFRHDRNNKFPHDVVVVDETSMVSLSLMAKLVEAVRTDARMILVGDPNQLASVEAGAVLGDVVGPGTGPGIVVLRRVHRFGRAIAELAAAIQSGDADTAIGVLRASGDDVNWIDLDVAENPSVLALSALRDRVVDAGKRVTEAARAGDARAALDALRAMRILCAHRRGPYGVSTWTDHVEQWLATSIDGYGDSGPWYVGRPLLVTQNDYALRLYNGDTGVIISAGQGDSERNGTGLAAFDRGTDLLTVSPRRLANVDTVHAMTVHKSQGSQFDAVAVILPSADSPILTRELLYTAVTRAQTRLTVVGTEAGIRAAVERPIARASGLRGRLWTGEP